MLGSSDLHMDGRWPQENSLKEETDLQLCWTLRRFKIAYSTLQVLSQSLKQNCNWIIPVLWMKKVWLKDSVIICWSLHSNSAEVYI